MAVFVNILFPIIEKEDNKISIDKWKWVDTTKISQKLECQHNWRLTLISIFFRKNTPLPSYQAPDNGSGISCQVQERLRETSFF